MFSSFDILIPKGSSNKNISVQVKGKQPKSFKNVKKYLFNFLNFQTF